MTTTCRVCLAPTDAFLCAKCGRKLEQAIAELPADFDDLGGVQARTARGPLGLGAPTRSCERADRDGAWEPPGPHTREALGDAPWPLSLSAADQRWATVNTMQTWIAHLVESRGGRAPKLTRHIRLGYYIQRNRMHVHVELVTSTTIAPLATWLIGHMQSIRFDEAAAVIFDELTGLHEENNRWILGRSGTERFAGRCDAAQVTFELDGDALVPKAATCAAPLYGYDNEDDVKCQACGMKYSLGERLAQMRDEQINEQLATAHTIANALTTLDEPLAPMLLRKWIQRDSTAPPSPEGPACESCGHGPCELIRRSLILARGVDKDGRWLYRFGDVRARLALVQRQRGAKLSA